MNIECRREGRIGVFGGHMTVLSPEWEEVGGGQPQQDGAPFPNVSGAGQLGTAYPLEILGRDGFDVEGAPSKGCMKQRCWRGRERLGEREGLVTRGLEYKRRITRL